MEQLSDGVIFAEGWLDAAAARQLMDSHVRENADNSGSLWPILTLGLWFDRNIGLCERAS